MSLKKILEWFEKKKVISLMLLLINLGIIIYFSSLPGTTFSVSSSFPAVIYHFTVFAGLAFCFLMTISDKKIKGEYFIITILVCFSVGILDEIHQLFVPFRSCCLQDALTDLSGILYAILIYFLIKKLPNKD